MARTMKRKLRTNKKFGKRATKRSTKKNYKKKNLTSLRKMTKKRMHRRRRGSRKMRGGVEPEDDEPFFAADEDAILPAYGEEEDHDLDVGDGEGPPDFGDESNGPLNMSDLQGITRDSGETSVDTGLSESNPNLSMSSFSMGEPEGEEGEEDLSQMGGKKKKRKGRKGKKTQKRRGKKGGELPGDYNPNDRSPDLDHD